MSIHLPDNVRIQDEDGTRIIVLNTAQAGARQKTSTQLRMALTLIGVGLASALVIVLSTNSLWLLLAKLLLIILGFCGLVLGADALGGLRRISSRLVLHPDRIESALFSVPHSAIRSVAVQADGQQQAVVVHAAGVLVRLVHHHDGASLESIAALIDEWRQEHPVLEDDADFTVRMPMGVRHETVLGEQLFVLGISPATIVMLAGMLILPVVMLAGWSVRESRSELVVPLLLGSVVVAAYIRHAITWRNRIILSQRVLKITGRTVSLEGIQAVEVHERGRWNTLVVSTAAEEVVVRHREVDVLRALQAPIEQQACRQRGVALAVGADPDDMTLPSALERLRQPDR